METQAEPWLGQRYYPISQYYRNIFGEKVYKISVSVAHGCPNRRDSGSKQVCIFCDEWGSAAYHLERDKTLVQQIRTNRERLIKRVRAHKFLVYFQAYTNTFEPVSQMAEWFDLALAEKDVFGLVVGTRPDCLPQRLFPLLAETHARGYLSVELGVQSFFDDHLAFLRRGHSAEKCVEAVHRLHDQAGVDIGIHLMFGLPGETEDHIIRTAKIVNSMPISNVKLHNLHVLKNTPLAELYEAGSFQPIDLEPYAEKVVLFLRHLSPKIAVQRLTAVAGRWWELVAPSWTKEKMRPADYIRGKMTEANSYQGDCSGIPIRDT